MRKLLLTLAASAAALAGAAALVHATQGEIPAKIEPFNLQAQFDRTLLAERANVGIPVDEQGLTFQANKLPQYDWADTDTTTYFSAAQTFYKNYSFTYEGGDVKTYEVGIAIDGDQVTISNLFNLYEPDQWSVLADIPVTGTYDAAAGTITIPTNTNFSNATICANIWNYYIGVLFAGTVNSEGKLSPSDNLVFKVEGDFERITATNAFGLAEFSQDGLNNFGFYTMYRSFVATVAKEGSELITFNDYLEYGETFPNTPVEKTIVLVNLGSDEGEYGINVDSDANSFTTPDMSGTIPGHDQATITFVFNASEEGEYEGLATIDGEYNSLDVQMLAEVIPFPDFSGIVKEGEFEFSTNNEFPFEPRTLDDGTAVAWSTTNGNAGSSKLTATFTVPEGKIGTFSCKGTYKNTSYWYSSASGIFVDNMDYSDQYYNESAEFNYVYELAPGEHIIRIQHDQYNYTGNTEDYTYVTDFSLTFSDIEEDAAELKTPEIQFGTSLIEAGATVSATLYAELINKGSNPLQVTAITSDNDAFYGTVPSETASLLEPLQVPISLKVNKAGEYAGTLSIATNAGTYEIAATASVLDMPDFAQIVDEGAEYMTFTTDSSYPFLVEDGVAYNSTSKVPDESYRKSWVRASFTVPEGKLGYLSWEGTSWGTPSEIGYYDYGQVEISHPLNTGSKGMWGAEEDASSNALANDDYWKKFLSCIPGDHYIEFQYYQGGDNAYYGEDRIEISHLKLTLIDFEADNVELLTPEVEFESTYVGPQRYTTATVQLHNTGSNRLYVKDIPAAEPFYGIIPNYNDNGFEFDSTVDVTLWFYPTEEGDFTGDLVIQTSGGDVTVKCHGATKSQEGIIYPGDFEDQAYGWSTYDADNDGSSWDLGTNMWYYEDPTYVHSGIECLASASYSFSYGSITPDNWTFSPAISVPEDGDAKVTYYIGAFSPNSYSEHYSFYITTDISSVDAIADEGAIIEETIDLVPERDEDGNVGGWLYREFDLQEYAGQDIYLVFRHHDCTGQYLIRLDDVFVYGSTTGIGSILTGGDGHGILRQEIYNANGVQLPALQHGLNIVVTVYEDGSRVTSKLMFK